MGIGPYGGLTLLSFYPLLLCDLQPSETNVNTHSFIHSTLR